MLRTSEAKYKYNLGGVQRAMLEGVARAIGVLGISPCGLARMVSESSRTIEASKSSVLCTPCS